MINLPDTTNPDLVDDPETTATRLRYALEIAEGSRNRAAAELAAQETRVANLKARNARLEERLTARDHIIDDLTRQLSRHRPDNMPDILDAILAARRQIASDLGSDYAVVGRLLEIEIDTLEKIRHVLTGNLDPLYTWLPVGAWTAEMCGGGKTLRQAP